MSQKTVLIVCTIAILLVMTIGAEAKRIGCASFGHSCYGGHGKRSDPSIAVQDIDTADQPPLPVVRYLQRRFQDAPANEIAEHEKEVKLVILSVLNNVIEDSYRKLTAPEPEMNA